MNARFTRNLLTAVTAATAFFSAGTAMAQAKSDFNDDGKADLVWRNEPADATHVWFMSGAGAIGSGVIAPVGGPNWNVGAVGDIDGNGRPDLVLRNNADGSNFVWFMGLGVNVLTSGALPAVADQNWKIAGVADFNFDGREEIVWRHYGTGANSLWTTANTPTGGWSTYTGSIALPSAPVSLYLGGVADFDNNGSPDLVFHNTSTGANTLWMMGGTNSATRLGIKTLATSAVAVRPEAVADYTGDGCIDIVMRNSTTGATELWTYDCSINRVSVAPIATVDLGWQLGVH